ncbi:MAG TPA: hypothetical protein VJB99_00870 [Patescibacteria group bacterium]|nr:hypothetical protein [Patescibacteria group bacterium]
MLVIPVAPEVLRLPVVRLWNGDRSPDTRLDGLCEITRGDRGVKLKTFFFCPGEHGKEDGLEIWFVDEDNQNLRIRFDSDGGFRVLGCEASGEVIADLTNELSRSFSLKEAAGRRCAEGEIPFELFPSHVKAINAFLFSGKTFLAYHPLSDPHDRRTETFPLVKLASVE